MKSRAHFVFSGFLSCFNFHPVPAKTNSKAYLRLTRLVALILGWVGDHLQKILRGANMVPRQPAPLHGETLVA